MRKGATMHHSLAYELLTTTITLMLWAIYFLDAWLEKKPILKCLKWSEQQKKVHEAHFREEQARM
jgi:hypothetical protein